MKNKLFFYTCVILIVACLFYLVYLFTDKLKINTDTDRIIKDAKIQIEKNAVKSDSIDALKQIKEAEITKREKTLYDNVAKAKQNNIRYEQIKKNISNTDDADSLARQLTNRYSKR